MKKRNIILKTFRFIFSFIVTFMLVTCQIMPCIVFAEALPDPSFVEVPLWTVIEGGADQTVENVVKAPFLFSSEIDSLFALNAVAKEHYWNETKATINQKIADGTISASDLGYVLYYEVDGERVPVGVKHSILYGDSMFFLTDDLAYKIQTEQLQSEQAILDAVEDYWERVIVSDIQPFKTAVANLNNWVTSVHSSTSLLAHNIVSESFWNAFGVSLSTPSASFFQDGVYGYWLRPNASNVNLNIRSALLNENYDYFVLKIPDANGFYQVRCYYYDPAAGDFIYHSGTIENGRLDFNFMVINDLKETSMSFSRFDSLILDASGSLKITDVFSNWDLIVSLPDVAPSIQPGIRYNVGAIEGAVDDIAELAQEAIDANSDVQGNPDYNPGDFPVIDPDVLPDVLPDPYPSPLPVEFPQDFPDPDPWIDPSSNPFPDPVPNPGDDPGGDGPGGDDPGGDDSGDNDNDWDDQPPERPRLRVPVLLTLFPFCIPFDIKRSIEWFGAGSDEELNGNYESISANYVTGVYNNMSPSEAEEINGNGMEPVFAIPLNIGVSGRPVLQTTVVLDLTEYGIPVLVQYLKTVQIIAWIIVLGVATYKFIY